MGGILGFLHRNSEAGAATGAQQEQQQATTLAEKTQYLQDKLNAEISRLESARDAAAKAQMPNPEEARRIQGEIDQLQEEKKRIDRGELSTRERVMANVRDMARRGERLLHGLVADFHPLQGARNLVARARGRLAEVHPVQALKGAKDRILSPNPEKQVDKLMGDFDLAMGRAHEDLGEYQTELVGQMATEFAEETSDDPEYTTQKQELQAIIDAAEQLRRKLVQVEAEHNDLLKTTFGSSVPEKWGDVTEDQYAAYVKQVQPIIADLSQLQDQVFQLIQPEEVGIADRQGRFSRLRDRLPGRPDILRRGPNAEKVQAEIEEKHFQIGDEVDYLVEGAGQRIASLEDQLKALQEEENKNPRENRADFVAEFRILRNQIDAARDDLRAFSALQAEYQRLSDRLQALELFTQGSPEEMAEILTALKKLEDQVDNELGPIPRIGRMRRIGNQVRRGFSGAGRATLNFIVNGSDLQDTIAAGAVTFGVRAAMGPVGWAAGAAVSAGGVFAVDSRRMSRALNSENERAVETGMAARYAQLVNPGAYHKHQLEQLGDKEPSRASETMYYASRGFGFFALMPDRLIAQAYVGIPRKARRWGEVLKPLVAEISAEKSEEDKTIIIQESIKTWLNDQVEAIAQNIQARDWERVNQDINQLNRLLTDAVELDLFTDIGLEHFRGRGEIAKLVGNKEVGAIAQAIVDQRESFQNLLVGYQNNQELGEVSRKARMSIENLLAMLTNPDEYRQDRALKIWKKMRTSKAVATVVKAGLTATASDGMAELLEGRNHEAVAVTPQQTTEVPQPTLEQPLPMSPMPEQPLPMSPMPDNPPTFDVPQPVAHAPGAGPQIWEDPGPIGKPDLRDVLPVREGANPDLVNTNPRIALGVNPDENPEFLRPVEMTDASGNPTEIVGAVNTNNPGWASSLPKYAEQLGYDPSEISSPDDLYRVIGVDHVNELIQQGQEVPDNFRGVAVASIMNDLAPIDQSDLLNSEFPLLSMPEVKGVTDYYLNHLGETEDELWKLLDDARNSGLSHDQTLAARSLLQEKGILGAPVPVTE